MKNFTTNGGGEVITQTAETYHVHLGCIWGFYNEDADLDNSESLDTLLVVGSKPLHITLDLTAFGGQILAYIYEDPQYSSPGTLGTMSAFNRVHSIPIETKFYKGPTITDVGNVFVARRVLAHSQGAAGITTAIRFGVERVFKPFTSYLLRQTATGDNISVTLAGVLCEH